MAVKLECRGKVGATQECAACGKKIHDRFLLKVRIQDTQQIPPQGQDTGYTTDSSSRSGYRIHDRFLLKVRIQDTRRIPPQGQDTGYTTDSSPRLGLTDIRYRIHNIFLLKVRYTRYKVQDTRQVFNRCKILKNCCIVFLETT